MSLFTILSWRTVWPSIEFTVESSYLSGFEKVVLLEMPGQAEITVDNSYQIVGNETVMGNETEVGNDSNPDTGSSPLSIPPSVGEFEMILWHIFNLDSPLSIV